MSESGVLDEQIDRGIVAAETAWPGCDLDGAVFKGHLLSILGGNGADPATELANIYLADLYLAQACVRRTGRAVQLFANKYLSRVDQYVGYLRRTGIHADEIRRELEDALVIGRHGAKPRLEQYRGRGPLSAYVATTAKHITLTLVRRQRATARRDAGSIPSHIASGSTMKPPLTSRYEDAVRDAVRESLAVLDSRERTIVRLHLFEGVTLTQIAKMLRVHQSTVSRSLDAAFKRLHSELRRRLRDAHGFDEADVRSIVSDMRSHVNLSLSRILQASAGR